MSVEVQRVDAGSSAKLSELLQTGNPFVVTDSVDEGAREKFWSPSGLRSRVGAREVSVTRSDSETFDYTEDGRPLYSDVLLSFAEALKLIESSTDRGPFYYLRRSVLDELGLDNDDALPSIFRLIGRAKRSERLWVSSEGSVTPLHYDTRNNLLTQMHGSKTVTLFSSSEHERMYPIGFAGTNLLSHVDPDAVDESRFPNFPSASRITVDFKPGETLFIPPFWWHHVRSREFSISINVFWQLRPEQCLVPNSIEYLRVIYKRNGLTDLFTQEGEPGRLRFAKLAARAHELGLNKVATLFCAASARMTLLAMERSVVEAAAAPGPGVDSAGVDKTTAGERARLEHFIFLGGIAAIHNKTPKSSALGAMAAEVFQLAMRVQEAAEKTSTIPKPHEPH